MKTVCSKRKGKKKKTSFMCTENDFYCIFSDGKKH